MNIEGKAEPTAVTSSALRLRDTGRLLYRAGVAWDRDNVMRLSAAVAMYAILSISPLLIITIKLATVIFGEEAASRLVQQQVESTLGPAGAKAVEGMILNTFKPGSGALATAFSIGLLLFTASGVFNELRDSLNTIWNIPPKTDRGIRAILRDRLLSVGMVFLMGLLLFISHVISVSLTWMSDSVGNIGSAAVGIDLLASTVVIAILFAMLFRILPDARLGWNDVFFGSLVTAVLFKLGQYLQALYFTYGATASAYGAAGSFVVVLLWVYYSCWIFFFGAELIEERARFLGRAISHSINALQPESQ